MQDNGEKAGETPKQKAGSKRKGDKGKRRGVETSVVEHENRGGFFKSAIHPFSFHGLSLHDTSTRSQFF
jgi:hypothetical protein